MATEIVGWAAALILLLTISSQVYQQWKSRSTKGVSPWLFAGQVAASIGFTVYSVLVGNVVFVVTNALMLLSAIVGQLLYWRNARKAPAIVETIAERAGIPVATPKRRRPRAQGRKT
jgi:MtN3 and saliva related transmembrane protein